MVRNVEQTHRCGAYSNKFSNIFAIQLMKFRNMFTLTVRNVYQTHRCGSHCKVFNIYFLITNIYEYVFCKKCNIYIYFMKVLKYIYYLLKIWKQKYMFNKNIYLLLNISIM